MSELLLTISEYNFCFSVYRLVTVLMPDIRGKLIKLEEFGFRMRPSAEQQRKIEHLLTDSTYSDWLIIYYLVQCMDKGNFRKLINQVGLSRISTILSLNLNV